MRLCRAAAHVAQLAADHERQPVAHLALGGRKSSSSWLAGKGRLLRVSVMGGWPDAGRSARAGGRLRTETRLAEVEGLRGGKRRWSIGNEAAVAAPRRIWGIPAAFLPDSHRGRGEARGSRGEVRCETSRAA